MKATVDRLEGDYAVLLARPNEHEQILMPRRLFPSLKEGDIVDIVVTIDKMSSDEARERVSSLIERLKKKSD
jgi:hypothetical protein